MRYLAVVVMVVTVVVLTILTQVGGVVYLFSLGFYPVIRKHIRKRYWRMAARLLAFAVIYLVTILVIVPPLAARFGRVPLPLMERNHVRPLTIWTAVMNRNYVRPELRSITYSVGIRMREQYPGTVVNYLDAGFPFFNQFPLIPHLSHHDGKKLDIAFHYIDKASGQPTDRTPSAIGYGGSEYPRKGEPDRPAVCAARGYWQYGFMARVIPVSDDLSFDARRTKAMIDLFTKQKGIAKILIEPHLKERLRLTSNKIRLHGCNAVRHDDHIHVQLY